MRKIPTLFIRDFTNDNGRYVLPEVTPGCEWVLCGVGVATRKWDGTCVLAREDGTFAARREVKAGKTEPEGFVAIEHDDTTGKTVGWEPAEQSGFAKYIAEATLGRQFEPGTYELVGPKVNGNPDGFPQHQLVRHGGAHCDDVPRDFEGLRAYLLARPAIEGLVFWRDPADQDAGMVKIKRRDFRADR